MTRLILATLGLSLILGTAVVAQVKIAAPPQQYKTHEEIPGANVMSAPTSVTRRAAVHMNKYGITPVRAHAI